MKCLEETENDSDICDECVSEATAAFETARILDELQRRDPEKDWRKDPACPDCGSMEHFECP